MDFVKTVNELTVCIIAGNFLTARFTTFIFYKNNASGKKNVSKYVSVMM